MANEVYLRPDAGDGANGVRLRPDAADGAASYVPRGRAALVAGAIILAAWAGPQLSALKGSAAIESGPVVEQVQPPKTPDQQVSRHAAWRVTWDTQRRPKAIVSVDNPPRRRVTPSVEEWRQTWATQRAPLFVHPSVVVPDAQVPPPRAQAHIGKAWESPGLSALRVSTATEGGDWVLPVDTVNDPPPRAQAWLWAVLAQHQPARFGTYSSGVYTYATPPDDPPRLKRQDLAGAWPRGWTLPQTTAKFPIAPAAPAVDNPPPRVAPPSVEAWRQTWATQRAPLTVWSPVAAAVDDPPFRLLTAPAAIATWAPAPLTALRVSAATEEGAAPPVAGDPPPVKRLEMPAAIAAWRPAAFGSYSSGVYVYVAPPEAPPVRVVQPTTIREQWQARATWQVPQRLPAFTEGGAWVGPVEQMMLLRWLRIRRGRGE